MLLLPLELVLSEVTNMSPVSLALAIFLIAEFHEGRSSTGESKARAGSHLESSADRERQGGGSVRVSMYISAAAAAMAETVFSRWERPPINIAGARASCCW